MFFAVRDHERMRQPGLAWHTAYCNQTQKKHYVRNQEMAISELGWRFFFLQFLQIFFIGFCTSWN